MDDDNLSELLLQEKPNRLLKQLRFGESYSSELRQKIDSTNAHTIKLLNRFQDHELVKSRKQGRKKMISFTEEGETVADAAVDYLQTLEEV
jgi:predicted transcriptional regulator